MSDIKKPDSKRVEQATAEELLRMCFNSKLPVYECKFRMRHKDEHCVWILDRGKVVGWDKDEKPVRMSGCTANVISNHGSLEEGVNFIQKPFFEAGSCLQNTGDAG